MKRGKGRFWRRFGKGYRLFADALLGGIVLLIILNVVGWGMDRFWLWQQERKDSVRNKRHAQLIGLSLLELAVFKKETWTSPWQYEPWIGFRERARRGRYVNVHEQGYRMIPGVPERPQQLILLFGGSTTFGYNVKDDQTIAAYLQQELNADPALCPAEVRNFGQGAFSFEQESVFLVQLLKKGLRPQVVIFLDGLNEGGIYPSYTEEMASLFEAIQHSLEPKIMLATWIKRSPFFSGFSKYLPFQRLVPKKNSVAPQETPAEYAERTYQNYRFVQKNARGLCQSFQIRPFFFLQPIPGFRNAFRKHPMLRTPNLIDDRKLLVMERLSGLVSTGEIVDISGLLAGYPRQPFVDDCHYAPEVSQMIAREIFRQIRPALAVRSR